VDWLTPPDILKRLGKFDLDPCCPENMPWRTATTMFIKNQNDGLKSKWHGRVWLNPPYGSETGKWMARMAEHGDGIALIFARTETKMFFDHVWPKASGLLFLAGRPHFHHVSGKRAAGNSGGPIVLVAYDGKTSNWNALCNSKIPGMCVDLGQCKKRGKG
jgi:hypothetical protein